MLNFFVCGKKTPMTQETFKEKLPTLVKEYANLDAMEHQNKTLANAQGSTKKWTNIVALMKAAAQDLSGSDNKKALEKIIADNYNKPLAQKLKNALNAAYAARTTS